MILVGIYVLVVCMFCLWVLGFPGPINRNTINAADIDRFSTVGLGEPQKIRELAEALCEINYDVYSESLPTKLERALVDALSSIMPAPSIAFYGNSGWPGGRFRSTTWTIELNSDLIIRKNFIDLLVVLTHELRHAEQKYLAIKYHLKYGHSAEYIQSFLHSPSHIVASASNDLDLTGKKEIEFGQFISSILFSHDISNRRNQIKSDLNESINKDDFNYYLNAYFNELPREKDAKSFEQFLRHAIEDCWPLTQR